MSWFVIAGLAIIGLIWIIGSFTTLSDLLDNGKSLKTYREQYGKDLGMLICCTYRGAYIVAWPVVGFFGFLIGLVRDIFNIFK